MANDLFNKIEGWRRYLHTIPEIGFQEFKTSQYLFQELEKMGYHPVFITKTGIMVYIDYHQEKTLAFRSDIDALEIKEENDVAFKSHHQGFMHACGHDGHMAALLGLAYCLKDVKDLKHNILLIFQPGEEISNGSKMIIDTGIFTRYNVKGIFGMHMFPDIDEGKIVCRKGPLMAQSGELDVIVRGKSAHAGKYHEGIDSIVIASQLINEYQTILSRMISPMQSAVIHIGCIQGGTVRNIVADKTEFHGTVRTYSEEIFQRIVEAMKGLNEGKEKAFGCQIDFSCQSFNPPVLNDKNLYHQFTKIAGDCFYELEEPVMLAEDFSHYQKIVPGVFFFVGTKCQDYQSGLHTSTFQFHENVLLKAVELYYQLALKIELED